MEAPRTPAHPASSPRPIVVRAADGVAHSVMEGNTMRFKLGGAETGGALALCHSTVPPGAGVPPHVHEREDEVFIVLEGALRVTVAGETYDVGAGDVAFLPRGIAHSFANVGAVPAQAWVIATPSGFEVFYGAFATAARAGADFPALAAVAGAHGVGFLPPPVEAV